MNLGQDGATATLEDTTQFRICRKTMFSLRMVRDQELKQALKRILWGFPGQAFDSHALPLDFSILGFRPQKSCQAPKPHENPPTKT
jgi:hypothetical protein